MVITASQEMRMDHYNWQPGTRVDWTAACKIGEHKESGPLPFLI